MTDTVQVPREATESPVPEAHPMMRAWERYKASPEYANSFRWAAQEPHRAGSLWAAFVAGWQATDPRETAGRNESYTVFDPFLGKEVEISERLTDRLRGRYACGPTLPNGEPEFGWREFGPTPPIQHEAAAEIERLTRELAEADRRAGEAERYLERLKVEQSKERNWIWEAKAARGYDQNVSFDRVWAETCAKADRIATLTAEREAAERVLDLIDNQRYAAQAENKQLRAQAREAFRYAYMAAWGPTNDHEHKEVEKAEEALWREFTTSAPGGVSWVQIDFPDAVRICLQGGRVRRLDWNRPAFVFCSGAELGSRNIDGLWMQMNDGRIGAYTPSQCDMLSSDWTVVALKAAQG